MKIGEILLLSGHAVIVDIDVAIKAWRNADEKPFTIEDADGRLVMLNPAAIAAIKPR